MYGTMPSFPGDMLPGQKNMQEFPPIPMVYERVPAEPLSWEYHVLIIDTREADLPSTARLNELGEQGWVLVGVLNAERHNIVHYYFVRRKSAPKAERSWAYW